jgi:hypothetical protein
MIEMELDDFIVMPDQHLEKAAREGETIILVEFGRKVGEVKPLPGILEPRPRPQLGSAVGQGKILPGCFDPLPDDILDAFEGKNG